MTDSIPVTHEMFMRWKKDEHVFEWRFNEQAECVRIPEDAAGSVIESIREKINQCSDMILKGLVGDLPPVLVHISAFLRSAKTTGKVSEKDVSSILKDMSYGGLTKEVSAIFEATKAIIKELNSLTLMTMLFDAAKNDPNGNWVSASDDPIVPGQLKIGG